MPLSKNRVHCLGRTDYAWEREALDFIVRVLPDRDPHHVWLLGGMPDPAAGRHHDLDALVLGYHQLYLVEIKSRPGIYRGDSVDWHVELEGERTTSLDCPFGLADRKARILGSRLDKHLSQRPRVQALVFLSAENVTLKLSEAGRMGVVTRSDFERAITHGDFPGSDGRHKRHVVSRPMMQGVLAAFDKIGLRPRHSRSAIGSYELHELLEQGDGYREYLAVHRSMPAMRRRARVYVAEEQTDAELRRRLQRAARRDARALSAVASSPGVLHLTDVVDDAAPGPTLLFDDFAGAQRLDTFLRDHPELPFDERVELVLAIGQALEHCHRNDVLHGALSPHAVLVRKSDAGPVEVRLHNFQLGAGEGVTPTLHRTTLLGEVGSAYQAPEVSGNPGAISPLSDLFSLGALAYLIFTGRAPARDSAELRARLREDHYLDPSAATDVLAPEIVEHVQEATAASPELRAKSSGEPWDVRGWTAHLFDLGTSPEPSDHGVLDPYDAPPDSVVLGLRIVKTLGQGATARVREVERTSDGKRFALKVSSAPEQDERLRAEAEVLGKLRHTNVVALEAALELGGRVCLLLELAGDESLQRRLQREGPLSIADAKVLGSDLLAALEALELAGVLHRDLKPANIGLGAAYSGRRAQLTLFDFSAAALPVTAVTVGTPGYRDPFLEVRKAADASADRYSAAVVLHELLTGERPSYGGTDLGPQPELRLAAARFDPSARDALVAFFARALHHDAAERFDSADEMRRAWSAALETSERAAAPARGARAGQQLGLAGVGGVERDTPIAALPLSPKAKNALDRAGVVVAEDLLRIPQNRLHAMRSVGAAVAKEILEVRREYLASIPDPSSQPFYPDYRGRDLGTMDAFERPIAHALRYAGLHTLSALASAHRGQIEKMAERHEGFDLARLVEVLDREQAGSPSSGVPADLDGWVRALLPADKKHAHARALFGLEGPLAGRPDASVRELAQARGVQRQAIYHALAKARDRWAKHPAADVLADALERSVAGLGGAGTLDEVASRVATELLGATSTEPGGAMEHVERAALVRVALEILAARAGEDDEDVLDLVRVHDKPFVCPNGLAPLLRALGEAADRLADRLAERGALAGSELAHAELRAVVEAHGKLAGGEPAHAEPRAVVEAHPKLDALRGPRLLDLAAGASKSAARSLQLEIYPRGMPAIDALKHTSAILASDLGREDVRERVARRYPEALPLPQGDALDALMADLHFVYDRTRQIYLRKDDAGASLHTTTRSATRLGVTALPGQGVRVDDEALSARAFAERLHIAREQRRFCVLGVSYDRARRARDRLLSEQGLAEVSLDTLLLEELAAICEAEDLSLEDVWAADAAGPAGEEWPELVDLMRQAARRALARLLPAKQPILLVSPGLIERFGLTEIPAALSGAGDARAERESEAVFLLVPTYDADAPRINDRMPIPNVMGLTETIPRDWLDNAHRSAAQ